MIYNRFSYFTLLFIIFLFNNQAYSAFLSNGFLVISQYQEVNDKFGKCHGKIFFPKLSSNNEPAILNINNIVGDFIKNYQFDCKDNAKYNILYDVQTGSKDFFSIKWRTIIGDNDLNSEPIKMETLNFSIKDGRLLSAQDILSPLAKDFMPEIVKLSKNNLATNTNWQQFLEKIANKEIQFYIFESQWYIIFNPNKDINMQIIEDKLPSYLLSKTISS